MNQSQPYMDMHSAPHMSSAQSYGPHSATAGSMPQYSHYQQSSVIPPGSAHYAPQPSYGGYSYTNGVTSPQSTHPNQGTVPSQVHPQPLQLPAMMPTTNGAHSYVASNAPPAPGYPSQHPFDTTGQIAPPGVKPRVTATLWEDEGSLCFQVEAKGVCVARREDNHFINGTKLLNVAGMTRGRRDGILKSEKTRHVVKIGPMHLKGVWIPFERALDFANKEKITDVLYPLFVHNIGGLLYNSENAGRTNAVVAATERRRMDSVDGGRGVQGTQPPSLHHHHSMQGTVGSQVTPTQHSIAPHPSAGRPGMERAHTFPTPPTSASSVNNTGYQNGAAAWQDQHLQNGIAGSQPLSIDTGLSNARSMPTTPATTPPGGGIQNMQSYPGQGNYDNSKSYYSSGPSTQNGYGQPGGLDRFGQPLQPNTFKSEMGPPSAPSTLNDTDHHDPKSDGYGHVTANGHAHSGSGDSDPASHQENGYMDNNASAYGTSRSQYSYNTGRGHPHLSPEMTGSPSQQPNSGRGTPRTLPPGQSGWTPDYQTPSRQSSTSNVYSVMGDPRNTNGTPGDTYSSAYSTSNKRGRDDDDQDHIARPGSRELGAGFDPKRRKTGQPTYGAPMGVASHMQQAIKTGGGLASQR